MSFSFNEIALDIETPGHYVEFDKSMANSALPRPIQNTLILGQKLETGSAANNVIIQVNSLSEAKALFGRGSMVARAFDYYARNESRRKIYVIGINDAAGSASATATITINTVATAAGNFDLMINGDNLSIAVLPTQTLANIATNIAASINANLDLPVTATTLAAVVTVTAKNKGTLGNNINLQHSYKFGQKLPSGMGVTITSMTGGAGDPDLVNSLAAIGNEQIATYVSPYLDANNLATLKNFIDGRFDGMVMEDGWFGAVSNTTLTNNQNLGANHNVPFGTIAGQKGLPEWSVEAGAAYIGAIANETDKDPARPLTHVIVKGLTPPRIADRHTRIERQLLLKAGISTLDVIGENVVIDRVVSLYKTNEQGEVDASYQDLNSLLTLYYLRWSYRHRIATKYPRHKLGDDGGNYSPNQPVVTPNTLKAEILSLFKLWENAALVENFPLFKSTLIVVRDANNRKRVNIQAGPDLINQFLVSATQFQFRS